MKRKKNILLNSKPEYYDDILIHPIIFDGIKKVYSVEIWLRRIFMIILDISYGKDYADKIPKELRQKLIDRMRPFKDLAYVYERKSWHLIETAWLDEFGSLLIDNEVKSLFRDFTGTTVGMFKENIKGFINLRNLIAHNHGFSVEAMSELERLEKYFKKMRKIFLKNIYNNSIKNIYSNVAMKDPSGQKYSIDGYMSVGSKFDITEDGEIPFKPDEEIFLYKILKNNIDLKWPLSIHVDKLKHNYVITYVNQDNKLRVEGDPSFSKVSEKNYSALVDKFSMIDDIVSAFLVCKYYIVFLIPTALVKDNPIKKADVLMNAISEIHRDLFSKRKSIKKEKFENYFYPKIWLLDKIMKENKSFMTVWKDDSVGLQIPIGNDPLDIDSDD
ncbi:MAG: hypothetical protein A2Y03_06590 [Omnitrophica WOR_2 bacterium GWF2_38_59]|nr:MAG: hypothetical protein A2Y03_06590 [Omnitrophica WOR_2 bacterium GWF2_38_59]OGX50482.1 MAG: hypothetical protein A2243_01985 [Omnitrophica WOR_2 bacterium RIFOXYA2_FULL_38_17]OGX59491.1 MAG: hypothetical protein A2306_09610 [Omnitrophica WOR_2 bacterium RIFOXYB2_FULL_38_16]HBG62043.1 hypothetical protein [Candidatus Omnitrophota bacterium]